MTSNVIDFNGGEWAAHRQDHWRDFAGNPNFPDYLRVVFVAYARHGVNGHAPLDRGELAAYLVRKDGSVPERRVIWDALQKAIRLDYLDPGSQLLCLVVSDRYVQKRNGGDPDAACKRRHTKRPRKRGQRVGQFERTSGTTLDVRPSTSGTVPDVRAATSVLVPDVSRSGPSLSSLPHNVAPQASDEGAPAPSPGPVDRRTDRGEEAS